MKNSKSLFILGLAMVIISFLIPSGGGEIPQFGSMFLGIMVFAFIGFAIFVQRDYHKNSKEAVEYFNNKVPKIF